MSWQNQSGSNGGPRNPWGQGGGGGGSEPPNLDDILKSGRDQFKGMWPGGLGNKGGLALILLVFLAFYLSMSLYRVQPGERGAELFFGKLYETTEPGLNFHWWPIQSVRVTNTIAERQINIGFSEQQSGDRRGRTDQSLMLTGDENIVDIDFTVVWDIKDVVNYQFKIEEPELTVLAMAESAMREVIGRTDFQTATTEGRERVRLSAMTLLQATLDEYESGINIKRLQLLQSDPPATVIEAFRDVQRARADRDRMVNEAEAYKNSIIPEARGQAEKIRQESEAYKSAVVARAAGEAARFNSVYKEYNLAKDVTRKCIYLETMEKVLADMNKIIIDKKAGSGIVPYLPLNELTKQGKGDGK